MLVPGAGSALRFSPNVTFSRLGACTPEIDMVAWDWFGAANDDGVTLALLAEGVLDPDPEASVDAVPPMVEEDKLEGTALS